MIVTVSIQIDFEKADSESDRLLGRKAEQTLRGDGWDTVGEAIMDAMVLIDTPRGLQTLAIVVKEYFDRYGIPETWSSVLRDPNRFMKAQSEMDAGAQSIIRAFNALDEDTANGIKGTRNG